MKPKKKAKELYNKYAVFWHDTPDTCKQQCLIAVDEILKITAPNCDRFEPYYQELEDSQTKEYWKQVKQEIEKL